jgi:hypothetical protein
MRDEIHANNELLRADIKAAVDPLHERIDMLGATLRSEIREAQQNTIDAIGEMIHPAYTKHEHRIERLEEEVAALKPHKH